MRVIGRHWPQEVTATCKGQTHRASYPQGSEMSRMEGVSWEAEMGAELGDAGQGPKQGDGLMYLAGEHGHRVS